MCRALHAHQASNVLINAAGNGDLERALQNVKTDQPRASMKAAFTFTATLPERRPFKAVHGSVM